MEVLMTDETPAATPNHRSPSDGRAERGTRVGGELPAFDWAALVSQRVHPMQVAAIEALEWISQPLSATDMSNLFEVEEWYCGAISYHLGKLAEAGVIEMTATREVRGASEKFYFFAESD